MKKKKVLYLAALATTGVLALTGCEKESPTLDNNVANTQSFRYKELDFYLEEPEPLVLDAYQHNIYYDYAPLMSTPNGPKQMFFSSLDKGSIIIPEGYKIVETERSGDVVSIWFTNIVPVEIQPVFNEDTEAYDYSEFGTPIELEKETSSTLK